MKPCRVARGLEVSAGRSGYASSALAADAIPSRIAIKATTPNGSRANIAPAVTDVPPPKGLPFGFASDAKLRAPAGAGNRILQLARASQMPSRALVTQLEGDAATTGHSSPNIPGCGWEG